MQRLEVSDVVRPLQWSLSIIGLISTQTNTHTYNFFTLKRLKSFQHVSILRSLQGGTLFLAKVTFLKTLTD